MAATVSDYQLYAGLFLSGLPVPVRADLSLLKAADVVKVVAAKCRSRSHSWVKNFTAAVRSLLRFLFLNEQVPRDLTGSVLPAAAWRRCTLPKALDGAQVVALFGACDPEALAGRRDLAILTLAVRLGLRAAEIAALELGDIDWRRGEVLVHGKGGRQDLLPLPAGHRRGHRRVLAPRTSPDQVAQPLLEGGCPAHRHLGQDRRGCRQQGRAARGNRPHRTASASPHGSDGDAASRRLPARDRPGPPSRAPADNSRLRPGRRRFAGSTGGALADGVGMSALGELVAEYLAIRRALGYKLTKQAQILAGFVSYLEDLGATRITVEAALGFATQPTAANPIWWKQRLSAVRSFARYVAAVDPANEVPPSNLLTAAIPRAVPYLYSASEIADLMTAATVLRPALCAVTHETLIGLLAVTGMRVGEAIALGLDDVDLDHGLITIRFSKFNRERIVPLHPSTVVALASYASRRDAHFPVRRTTSFFTSSIGTRLGYSSVQRSFARLVREVGLESRSARCRPRLHDFRHRFAVETLLGWYRSGDDVAAKLPLLSTFLGHVKPTQGSQTVFS
jgi:integrase/recombinase XerD